MSDAGNAGSGSAPAAAATAPTTTTAPEGASAAASQAEKTAEAVRRFKVKIDGQETEVDENELVSGYQTRKAADKAFREGSMAKKQAEEFVNMLKTDPIKLLKDPRIGHDVRKLAEEYLAAQLEDEMMDPRDRELRDARKKLQDIDEAEKAQRQKEEAERANALTQQYAQDYQKSIIETLEESGLPKSHHTVKRMAFYMHEGLKRGLKIDPKNIVAKVREDYMQEHKTLFGQLDGETLLQLLGDDVATKIRKSDLKRLKNPGQGLATPSKQPNAKPDAARPQSAKLTKEEWRARNRKRMEEE